MMRLSLLLLVFTFPVLADSWSFGEKIAVSQSVGTNVFQHLDASGRKSIALSGTMLAVVWEDNRRGMPQAYVAFKDLDADKFSKEQLMSSGTLAYAPTIVALGAGRFLAGWEQDEVIWLRVVSPSGLGPSWSIGRVAAGQVALTTENGHDITVAWSQQDGRFSQIVTAAIKINEKDLITLVGQPKPVDMKAPMGDQSYPVLAMVKQTVTIAWEDRRKGHTVLLYSRARVGKPFSTPQLLNEVSQKSEKYGRGNGVTRVALAVLSHDQIGATWMDKRGYQTGYDIYAAFSKDAGAHFGANELVQDVFAEQYTQWRPAIAGNSTGQVVVAWDDDRDSTSSVWFSWKTKDGWSANLSPPPASSNGLQQTSPAITVDSIGNLHLVWIEQKTEDGPGRVMYTMGSFLCDPPVSTGAGQASNSSVPAK